MNNRHGYVVVVGWICAFDGVVCVVGIVYGGDGFVV